MAADLQRLFEKFCAFGTGKAGVAEMDNFKFNKLCRDTKLFDKNFTASNADVVFAKAKPLGERRISFATFRDVALPLIAAEKGCTVAEVVALLKAAEGPLCSGTKADAVKLHDDKSTFTGVSGWKVLRRASLPVVGTEVATNSPKGAQTPKALQKPKKIKKKKKVQKKSESQEQDAAQSSDSVEEDEEDDSSGPATPQPVRPSVQWEADVSAAADPAEILVPGHFCLLATALTNAATVPARRPSLPLPPSPAAALPARPLLASHGSPASPATVPLRRPLGAAIAALLPRASTVDAAAVRRAEAAVRPVIVGHSPPRRATLPPGGATAGRPPSPPGPPHTLPVAPGFDASNFKAAYDVAKAPNSAEELLDVLQTLLTGYAALRDIEPPRVALFFEDLKASAVKELHSEVQLVAARLWTSPRTLDKKEFCFILNELLREDHSPLMPLVATITRAINLLLVGLDRCSTVPASHVVFRGGGLPDAHRDFFAPGRKYRAPMFTATSIDRDLCQRVFCRRAEMHHKQPPVLWIIAFDDQEGCMHVNYIHTTECKEEQEYLFSPYSVFTVQTTDWKVAPHWKDPHIVHLRAAVDNRLEPEDLPLSPWA